jgi:hypothetical protein
MQYNLLQCKTGDLFFGWEAGCGGTAPESHPAPDGSAAERSPAMFERLKSVRSYLARYAPVDPEIAALNEAGDRIDVELIHRHYARNRRWNPFGY